MQRRSGTKSALLARLKIDPAAWELRVWRLAGEAKPSDSHFGNPGRLAETARVHGRRWHRNQFRRVRRPLRPVA